MATHDATFRFANKPKLGNKGILLAVQVDRSTIGHLMIGKASLVWFEPFKKKVGHKVSWEQLQTWMMQRPVKKATRPGK